MIGNTAIATPTRDELDLSVNNQEPGNDDIAARCFDSHLQEALSIPAVDHLFRSIIADPEWKRAIAHAGRA